ncbi:MAG: SufD family Fe-S cluster assembly protein [Candidatus Micrarchaeota archaeon]
MRYLDIVKGLDKELPEEPNPLYVRNSMRIELRKSARPSIDEMQNFAKENRLAFDIITNGSEFIVNRVSNANIEVHGIEDELTYEFKTKAESRYIGFTMGNVEKFLLLSVERKNKARLRLLMGGEGLLVIAKAYEDAELSLEEFLYGDNSIINEINAEKRSKVGLDIIQLSNKRSLNFYNANLGEGSELNVNNFTSNREAKSRNKVIGYAGSKVMINNIIMGKNSIVDTADLVNSKGPETKSFIEANAIGSYGSTISIKENSNIEKGAYRSESVISTKGINLDDSKIEAIPSMGTEENDVKASHAAAVSPISTEAIEYLMSRGISKSDSKKLILMGMLDKHIMKFSSNEYLKNKIDLMLNELLGVLNAS